MGDPRTASRRRRASGSSCSSAATGCRANRRTGSPGTCSWTTATCRPRRGTTRHGKAFQPQIHYFVGGATKLYGAALYRLRKEDFGELRHHDGISPAWPISYDELEPYYTQAEHALRGARCPRRGPDRAAGQRAVSVPRAVARASHPAARRRSRGRRLPPVPCAVRCPAERGQHAVQHLRALHELRRLPLRRAREVGCRGARRPSGTGARECHAAHERASTSSCMRTRRGRASPRSSSSTTASSSVLPPTSSSLRAALRTRPSCCSARRATSIRTGSRTARTRSAGTTCSTTARRCSRFHARRTRRSSRRRSGSTTSISRTTSSTTRSGTSRWSASHRPRCTGANSPARRSSRRSGPSTASRSMRSTSGSRPRICRCPRTASRSIRTASSP